MQFAVITQLAVEETTDQIPRKILLGRQKECRLSNRVKCLQSVQAVSETLALLRSLHKEQKPNNIYKEKNRTPVVYMGAFVTVQEC
jgi:hypothetical protein